MKRLQEAVSPKDKQSAVKMAQELLKTNMSAYDGKGFEYADMAVWLAFLRALGIAHQTYHWQTMGGEFYGDHLLFERLYKAVEGEVDTLAEKIVGVESPALTNYFLQTKHMMNFLKAVTGENLPPVTVALRAELVFIAAGEMILTRLEKEGLLTTGVENLFGDMLDRHESHVYLLQQRLALVS